MPSSARWPLAAGVVGILGWVATVVLGLGDPSRFYHSYLVAFAFTLSLALGGLFFVLLQFLTRAGWSVVVRRLSEHVMGTLGLFVLFFIPIALGVHDLYHWSHSDAVATDALLAHKEAYLNPGGFYVRAAIFLLSWTFLGWWFRRQSMGQDASGEVAITGRLQTLSAPAMIWFGVSMTLATVDWIMSLDPHWYSTIFGVYYFAGSVVGILALLLVIVVYLQAQGALARSVTAEHYHDLGKLLFGFTAFWAYIAFSQFMLIWYGNIPEETLWYAHRWEHGWQHLSVILALGHFVVPFFFLLPRAMKRRRALILIASCWMLLMHYLDLYWLVMPSFRPEQGLHPHLLDLTTLLAVGGVFAGVLGHLMRRSSLVPVRDPRLAESLAFENV
jgi:hypothetical protein